MHIDDFVINFLVRSTTSLHASLENVTMEMSEDERNAAIREARKALMEEMNPEGDKELQLKSFYYDNEFYMFEYKTYRDIRLVAAPPESVESTAAIRTTGCGPSHR